jgi:hypothetical protein
MKKDVKMLSDALEVISKKRKQINFDSVAGRQYIATEVVHELRKRKCHINRIELWKKKRQINTINASCVILKQNMMNSII